MRIRALHLCAVVIFVWSITVSRGSGSVSLYGLESAALAQSTTAPAFASQSPAPESASPSMVNPEVEPSAPTQRVLTLTEALAIANRQSRELLAARERLRGAYTEVERARAALLPTVNVQGKMTINEPEVTVALDYSSQVFGGAYQGAQILDLQKMNGVSPGTRGPAAGALYNTYCQNADPNRMIPAGARQACDMLAKPTQSNLDQLLSDATFSAILVPRVQFDGILAANIPLVVPSAYPALSGAKLSYRAQAKQLEVTSVQVLQAAAITFYQAAGLEEMVLARHNAIAVAQKTLDDARSRLSAGVVTSVDVTRAEQAVIKVNQDLLEAQANRGTAYRNLATLLMLTPGSFKVLPPPEPPEEIVGDDRLVNEALSQRPELANLDLIGRAACEQVRSSWLRWAPTLSGFGNIRLTNAAGFSGRNNYYAAGLQLDWQLFDGFVRDAQRHQFESQRRDALLRLDLLRDQVSDEVLIARANVLVRRRGLVAAQSAVRLANAAMELVRIQYEAATATQLDLLTAQDKLVQAEVGLAQARFDLALAALNLRRSLGEPLGASAAK